MSVSEKFIYCTILVAGRTLTFTQHERGRKKVSVIMRFPLRIPHVPFQDVCNKE